MYFLNLDQPHTLKDFAGSTAEPPLQGSSLTETVGGQFHFYESSVSYFLLFALWLPLSSAFPESRKMPTAHKTMKPLVPEGGILTRARLGIPGLTPLCASGASPYPS